MLRLLSALALALAATTPAFAQGKGGENAGKDRAGSGNAAKGGGQPDNPGKNSDDRDDRGNRGRDDDRRGLAVPETREWRGDAGSNRGSIDRADYRDGGRGQRDDDRTDRRGDVRGNWVERERFFASVPGCPPGLAKRNNGCLPPGIARQARDETFGYAYRPALFGVPLRAVADYVLYDGYLIPSGGGGGGRYLPLLGGALGVGQVWPEAYPSLPLDDWQTDYYGFEDPAAYRYADNVVYQVDPQTSAIEAVVALLSGSDFNLGERMPDGYDVYNVPTAYQDRYADSDEAMYRYDDGRVYEVDPVSMLVQKVIELIA